MSVIDLRMSRCQHCYRCVRHCPLKAIRIKDGQACIIAEQCILCGRCLEVCPQSAKAIHSEQRRVKGFLKEDVPVIASVAPSEAEMFAGAERGQLVAALKKLGFAAVRETSEGAAYVAWEYKKKIEQGGLENLLTTSCPSAVDLVEKYYPSLTHALLPVVSPMVAHARLIKQEAAGPVRVVFLGACISKKREAADKRTGGAVDAVITFQELEKWFAEEGIVLSECETMPFDHGYSGVSRLPLAGDDVLTALEAAGTNYGSYRRLAVDGLHACIKLLQDMEAGKVKNCLVQMNICEEGCLNGPAKPKETKSIFQMKADQMQRIIPEDMSESGFEGRGSLDLTRIFDDRHVEELMPNEDEIRGILRQMGKHCEEDELNCGACGYPSCREKAIAIYQGKAEVEMCIPYMHDKAESLANVVMETTPNAVLLIASDMQICGASKSAGKLFTPKGSDIVGRHLFEFIPTAAVEQVFQSQKNVYTEKQEYLEFGKIVLQTMVYVEKMDMVLAIFIDITEEEARVQRERELRMELVAMAQKVIDKQMMVAQEIAGLLGETTAETKVTLTKVSRSLMEETAERGSRS